MPRKRNGVSRREFMRNAALLSGGLAAVGVPGTVRGQSAGGAAPPKLGAQLIGKLEGPELILDPAKWPTKFSEAPMLAELVKQGKLPPVEQRIPKEPLVIKPVHEIGRYGGTWRRGFTGPGDGENGNRIVSADKLLFWEYTGTKVMPCVGRQWLLADDGKSVTLYLRKGHKWSDGKPFTADDFVFWYEDVYLNKDITPTPHPDFMINGKSGVIKKIDETTVLFEFPEPNYLFLDILAGSTAMGGGQALWQMQGRAMGAYMPAHYIKQFHPKYIGMDAANAKAKAANFDGWLAYIKNRWDWRLNPGAARADALEDRHAHQQPDLGDGAEPFLLRGRHRRQPASVHRPDPDDARREPRGAEPPGHRRPVRSAGAPHGHDQAPGVPREPGQGRLRRQARSRP